MSVDGSDATSGSLASGKVIISCCGLDLLRGHFLRWVRVLLRGVAGKPPFRQAAPEASKHSTGLIQSGPPANRQTR